MQWVEVEKQNWRKWDKAFSNAESFSIQSECPICTNKSLFAWYRLDDPSEKTIGKLTFAGRGFVWQWCNSCFSYRFISCQVPKDWLAKENMPMPPSELYGLSKRFTEFAS